MLIRRRATAKELQDALAGVPDLMDHSGGDRDRVARPDRPRLVADSGYALALEDVIDLLGLDMMVRGGAGAGWEPRFGQRLVADRGVPVRQKLADLGAVFGDEGRDVIDVFNVHGRFQ